MSRLMKHRPSPALAVAMAALFVALGGAGYAATVLPKASVGTAQLKANAVTSAKVKNGTLLAADFKAGQLPTGPQGLQGPQGPQGAAGAPGLDAFGTLRYVLGNATAAPGNAQTYGSASCPTGEHPVGGGVVSATGVPGALNVNSSGPMTNLGAISTTLWGVFMDNTTVTDSSFRVFVICAAAATVAT